MKGFVLLLALVASCIVRSTEGYSYAYAFVNRPELAMAPANSRYSYSPGGHTIMVQRLGVGRHRLFFNELVGSGAHAQVSMFSSPYNLGWCNLDNMSPGGGLPAFSLDVRCYDNMGVAVDRWFLVFVIEGEGSDDQGLAYARLHLPATSSYTADPNWQFGAGSFAVSWSSPGAYQVNLGSVADTGAVVLVTPFGGNKFCNLDDWAAGNVYVNCYNKFGNLANSASHVLAIKAGFPNYSFARNDDLAGALNPAYSYSSDGSAQSIYRQVKGVYRIIIGPEAETGGHVQVTALDTNVTCWAGTFIYGKVAVLCAKTNGATYPSGMVDARFTVIAFMRP